MVEDTKNIVGQRLMWTFDFSRTFKQKQQDGSEVELTRIYHIDLPYGAPFEEVYDVLDQAVKKLKELEELSKKQAEESKKKEEEPAIDIELN